MALGLTPGNLQYILGLSISSRLLILVLQFISNIAITDHYADAYRNKYHKVLASNNSLESLLPDAYNNLYNKFEGLTKWDAQYFLEISNDGYVSEKHLAFLPLYPILISLCRQILYSHTRISLDHLITTNRFRFEDDTVTVKSLENYISSAIVGITVNNFILFPIACISLFALTKLAKSKSDKYARNVVWWFCFNPASIFFSACYSESLFAALTFTAIFIIEYRSHNYLTDHESSTLKDKRDSFIPLSQLNRLIYITLPSIVPLTLTSATRSNGLVNLGFIGYQFLIKYVVLLHIDTGYWTFISYLMTILEIIQDLLVLIMSSVFATSGYVTFQIYSYIRFCGDEHTQQKGVMHLKPEWCKSMIPHPYGYVQAKFWNVGPFRYYEIKQLPNFLLAMPISYLMLMGSKSSLQDVLKSPRGRKQLAYYIQGIILTLLCGVSINVQVITRLVASSCPVFYWICEDISERSKIKGKLIQTYFLSYLALGTILHVNFFPWT